MGEEFKGKAVIITGASSGIGKATALLFAQRGAKVTLCGRDEGRLATVLGECQRLAGGAKDRFVTVVGDLREPSIQKKIVDQTLASFGRLDVLVNNAGHTWSNGGAMVATEELYDLTFDNNLKSTVFLTQAALPELIKTQGNIVNVSSTNSGAIAAPGVIVNGMTKAAIDQMTRCLALEFGPKGVRVNGIQPGVVNGTLALRHFEGLGKEEILAIEQMAGALQPLHGRGSKTEEQAEAILFLASDRASFITGHMVVVDGGLQLRPPHAGMTTVSEQQ